jgi:tetratricopeptide (TPR) repeat protein
MQKGKVVSILAWVALESLLYPANSAQAADPTRKSDLSRKMPILNQDAEAKLRSGLASLDVIIKKSPPGPGINMLMLTRCKLALSVAQKRILTSSNGAPDNYARGLLQTARDESMKLAQDPKVAAKMRAEALFISGESSLYLDTRKDTEVRFLESLKLDPASKYAPFMSFFLAEEAFDRQDFEKAKAFYAKCMTGSNAEIRRMALYKTAWSWLKQDKVETAVQSFISLIRGNPKDDMSRDARKDLAFIVSRFSLEEDVLKEASRLFPKPPDLLEFLRIIEGNREQQGKASLNSKILQRVVELEPDPIKRAQVYLSLMSVNQKDFASSAQFETLQRIKAILTHAKVAPASKQIAPIEKILDEETQKLARAYIGTFSGKTVNPENLSKATLSVDLKNIFYFYSYYFQNSKYIPTITQIWIDVCADTEDWPCIIALNRRVQSNPALGGIREKSSLVEIVALESLAKKDAKTYRSQLEKALDGFLKEFPKSTSWLRTAKRRADLYIEDKHFDDALPILDQVYAVEPNEENFYRAQWTRFQLHQYDELSNRFKDPKAAPFQGSERLQALKREALLEVAKTARDKGNVSVYTDSVKQFISSSSDAGKARIARQDLLKFYLEKELYPQASVELMSLSPKDRISGEYINSFSQLTSALLRRGEFQKSIELFKGIQESSLDNSLLLVLILSKLGAGEELSRRDLARLTPEQQSYINSLLCLTRPKMIISWFKGKAPQSENERKLAFLSLRLDHNQWEFAPSQEETVWLKGLLTEEMKPAPSTRVENKIQALVYPSAKAKGKRLENAIQTLVTETRAIREQITKEIQGKSPLVQRRIFLAAKGNEEKLAKLIQSSPSPEGLNAEQEAQYRAGLEELAKEFSLQAEEFGKLEANIGATLKEAEKQANARTLPVVKLDKWPWPSTKEPWIQNLLKSKNPLGALIVLDLWRKDWFPQDEKYYFYRTGILLDTNNGEVMRRYLYEELMAVNQSGVVAKCKEISQ